MRNMRNKIGKHYQEMFIEEKIIAFAGIFAVVGCLFGWSSYTVADNVFIDNAFAGKTWLIGWIILILSVGVILTALFPSTDNLLQKFGLGRMKFVLLVGLESILLTIIGVSVLGYSEYLTQELGTGIFITLLATAFMALGGFIGMRRTGSSALRPKANPQSDFLQFQEPKREHGVHDDSLLEPEESEEDEDEEEEEEEDQQSLNLD